MGIAQPPLTSPTLLLRGRLSRALLLGQGNCGKRIPDSCLLRPLDDEDAAEAVTWVQFDDPDGRLAAVVVDPGFILSPRR
jgi:hypothetical protein